MSLRSGVSSISSQSWPPKSSEAYAAWSLRGGHTPRLNDVFIAIMGVTGSGKSSFIQHCTDDPVVTGDGLDSCTQDVAVYAYEQSPNRTVYLLDTPGFNDSERSDTDVLRDIAGWLNDYYKQEILLSGIIYLHRITELRMYGSARRNANMFRKMCGDDALRKVVLVTTWWDNAGEPEATRVKRENQLRTDDKCWGYMTEKGSVMRRHYNTASTARAIVDELVRGGERMTLDIQDEMVNQRRDLDQTSAGQELQSEMAAQQAKWLAEKVQLERDMEEARREHDRQTTEELSKVHEEHIKHMAKIELSMRDLQVSQQKLHEERVQKLEQRLRQQDEAHAAQLKRHEEEKQKLTREKEELERQRRREAEKQEQEKQRLMREKEELEQQRRKEAERREQEAQRQRREQKAAEEREREKERKREKEREKERERQREKEREKEQERQREKERQRRVEREIERERQEEKERQMQEAMELASRPTLPPAYSEVHPTQLTVRGGDAMVRDTPTYTAPSSSSSQSHVHENDSNSNNMDCITALIVISVLVVQIVSE